MEIVGTYERLIVSSYFAGTSIRRFTLNKAEVTMHTDCNCSWWGRIRKKAKHTRKDHEWYRFLIIKSKGISNA